MADEVLPLAFSLTGSWDRHSDSTSSRSSGGSSNRSSCCRAAVFAPMDSPVNPATLVAERGRPTSASAVSGENSVKLAGDQLNGAGTAAQTRAHQRKRIGSASSWVSPNSCVLIPLMKQTQRLLGARCLLLGQRQLTLAHRPFCS